MRWRYFSIIFIFSALYLVLISNLLNLQYFKKDYLSQAELRNQLSGILSSERGNIYITDKNNNKIEVALNKD
ncbi:hypothetical protein COY96_02570, partial [Candidatus Wolfebacteria bacterium CG_4_10_14_0_8_um_filter_37_11]